MNRYTWPSRRNDAERDDDPAGRAGFMGSRRTELNLAAALAHGRRIAPPPRSGDRPGVFAQPTSRAEMWVPLGPSTVVEGQANGDPRVAGRVRSLYVHPDGDRLYAATANGGVWYSSDGGESWRSLGGFAATDSPDIVRPAHRHACGAILVKLDAAAPDDPTKDTVFVGTGELQPDDGRPGGQLGGIGVLVSTGPAASAQVDPWDVEAPNLREEAVYRFAAEPDGATIVAATTIGLLQRPAGAVAGTEWGRVAGTPYGSFTGVVSDVLWTRSVPGGPPKRLWAWVQGGDQAGLWVRNDGATNFVRIPTPGFFKRRGSLAAADPPRTVYVFNDRHSRKPADARLPALYRVTSPAAGTDPTAAFVSGVPDMLGHQGFYDLAVTVDPDNADQVVLGGSFTEGPPDKPAVTGQNVNVTGQSYEEDAAIFTAEVGDNAGTLTYGHSTPPLRIGVGCHADVHDLHFSDTGDLWAACDGGVFRSSFPDQNSAFVARNNGLNVVEANYVASHPTCEGRVVVGLQDNGIIERGSSTVWLHTGDGDGGGVAFDLRQTTRYVRQFFNGQWTGSDGGPFRRMLAFRPLAAPFNLHADAVKERDDSSFYSTPATIAHTRGAAVSPTHTQVLIGTTRPWYTDDWARTWVTLPSGLDPVTTTTFDHGRDLFGEPITVCKWATSDVAWILGDGRLERMVRVTGSDSGGSPGTWSRDPILEKSAKNKKDETSAEGPIRDALVWTDVEPNPDAGGALHGPKGAVYLGTVGKPGDDEVDTLWWFDGDGTWHPTGLRTHPHGVEAPVTAVRCDPGNPGDVYVGTTVGVWYGEREVGDPPTWDWRPLVNGLPEAAVEDLSLFDFAGLRLLRAAVASRGVWELRLGADVEDLTYVRAHDDDLRYRERAIEVQRDGATARSWHGSPDVRPRLAPANVPAPTTMLTRISPGPAEQLRRFQAALRSQSGDDRVRATGRWDLYFEDVLRDLGAPAHPVTNRMQIDGPYWASVMVAPDDTAEPWTTTNPTEADLMDQTPKLSEGDAGSVSVVLKALAHKVDVVVHHRGFIARPGADVRVTLLRWTRPASAPVPRRDKPSTWFTDDVPWAAAVDDVLNSAGGTTSRTFDQGWRFVGSNAAARRKTLTGQDLDNTRSGVVTFDLDLGAFRDNTVMLLAAVIRAGGNSSIATATLADLALEDPHMAVRSIVIERP